MFWADALIQPINSTSKHRVDDQSTPSGHYHVGSLRAVATHGIVYEAMKKAGYDVDFTYVFSDIDPMDGLPKYLDEKEYSEHMGKPLNMIPAPDGKSEHFAQQYAQEFLEAINKLGFSPTVYYTSDMYKRGDFDAYIKLALDHADEIREIYREVAKQEKPSNWYPFQVICPNCQKIGSSIVTDWDGTEVTYECKRDLVEWSVGCGTTGKISPFGGTGKLMWKVEWPAGWAALGVTVEGAGKDHMSAGGSHDIGVEIVKRVFKYDPPFSFMSEFFLLGGAKMSSSKGVGFRAIDMFNILPPQLVKFIMVRTPYKRAINFDLKASSTIPDLFDEYDRCAHAYFESGIKTDMGRVFEASQIGTVKMSALYLPRFRKIVSALQHTSVSVEQYFEKEKVEQERDPELGRRSSVLTSEEKVLLNERVVYAKKWLENHALSSEEKLEPTSEQIVFLGKVASEVLNRRYEDGEALQQALFELSKELNLPAKEAFQAIYIALINKTHGPKAGWLLLEEIKKDKDNVMKLFMQPRG